MPFDVSPVSGAVVVNMIHDRGRFACQNDRLDLCPLQMYLRRCRRVLTSKLVAKDTSICMYSTGHQKRKSRKPQGPRSDDEFKLHSWECEKLVGEMSD